MFSSITQAARKIISAETFQDVLKACAEQARVITDAHLAGISFADESGISIHNAVSGGPDASSSYEEKPDGSGTYSAWISKMPAVLRLTQEELPSHADWHGFIKKAFDDAPVRGMLAVPLPRASGGSAGVLYVSSKNAGEFTREDESLLTGLAEIAAGLLRKAWTLEIHRRNERRLKLLTDNLPALISYVDKDCRYIFTNAEYKEWFGKDPEEITGKHIRDIIGKTAYEQREQYIARALAGETVRFEGLTHHYKLGVRNTAITYIPEAPGAEITGFYVMVRDITERRKDEAAMRMQARVLGEIEDAVIAVDNQMRITYLNPAAERQYGVKAQDALGRALEDVYSYRWISPEQESESKRALEEKGVWRGENIHILKDGSLIYVESAVSLLKDNEGAVSGILAVIRDVTGRKKTEETLRRNENLYRAIGESIDYGIWICDAQGNNIYVSESFLKLVGLTQEECSQTGWKKVLHPDEADATIAAWKECVRTGCRWEREHRFLGTDGKWHPVLARGVPIKNEEGKISFWAGINLDISDLKRTENQLRVNSERMTIAQRAAKFGIFDFNVKSGVNYWAPETEALYGLKPGEFEGSYEGWITRVHPDDRAKAEAEMAKAYETGEYSGDFRAVWPDGSVRWLFTRAKVFYDEAGKPARMLGTNVDVTDRKEAEKALNESEERFRTLADNIAQFAWMADEKGWIFWYNKRWFDYTGTALPEMLGWGWRKVHHPDHEERVVESFSRAVEKGELWEDTFPLRGKDGNYRWFLSRAIPVREKSGKILRWFGTNTDITELKSAQEILERQKQELSRSNYELEQFAYVSSHDLQEPLRTVTSFSELLEIQCADTLDEESKRLVRVISDNALRASRLILDLLEYSRVRTTAKKFAPVNLEAVLRQVKSNLHVFIDEKKAEITSGPLPEISGDAAQMTQLLQNLVQNALKFHPPGKAPKVHLSAERAESPGASEWVISVSDNGIGIEERYLNKIFMIFQRLHSEKDYPGTGLGLAICKKIAENHGGKIWVESKPGQGSVFFISLPETRRSAGA